MKLILYKAFFLGISLIFNCGQSQELSNHDEINNKEIVAEAFENWQEGTGIFLELLDEQVEWIVVGSGFFQEHIRVNSNFWNMLFYLLTFNWLPRLNQS